jgi:hypothetical protein
VVGGKRLLDPIDAARSLVENATGVVEQHVHHPVIRNVEVSGHVPNLLLGRQIGDEQLGRGAAAISAIWARARLATPGITANHHDLGSRLGELLGCDEADAAVGTGHYDGPVVHVDHVVLRDPGC